ncbi:hypothetical protein IV203_033547 [Nitzschia inconspicua]|uniref:Uncharacterized protein n=1 Tax=Nitzschia inconspicua TaxID=303405 RepID=A0A9K3KAW6_9STRA|nr:hypothetical protein IV203_023736 [Nitzschia inconspicua]KAG7372823.1 hypothetical protein IV203_033547 [Nitzschia inconspicua]
MSDFSTAKRTWKPKSPQKPVVESTEQQQQLPSLFAASISSIPKKSKSYSATRTTTSIPPPINKTQPQPQVQQEKKTYSTTTTSSPMHHSPSKAFSSTNSSAIPSLFQASISTTLTTKSPKKVFTTVEKQHQPPPTTAQVPASPSKTTFSSPTTTPTATTTVKTSHDRKQARQAATASNNKTNIKTKSASMPVRSTPPNNRMSSNVSSLSPKAVVSSPMGDRTTGRFLGSPRPKSPQKNTKVVSVFHKPSQQQHQQQESKLSTDSTFASPTSSDRKLGNTIATRTPPLTPLSPEEQLELIRSLPFLYNVEPVSKIDISKTQSVLDKLKQAEYDNESVSSEAERLERHAKVGKGRSDETEIQDKLRHFWSNHDGTMLLDGSDNEEEEDSVSVSSAATSDSDEESAELFRY